MQSQRSWHRFDWILLIVTAFLIGIGLMVLQAITVKDGLVTADFNPGRQVIFALLGSVLFLGMLLTDYRMVQRVAPYIYVIGVVLLGLVLLVGTSGGGAKRWIDLGFWQFQPGEVMKLGLIIALAAFFARVHDTLQKPQWLIVALVIMAVPMVLVAAEPDLGTALSLGFIGGVMILSSRVSRWLLGVFIVGSLLATPVLIGSLQPYQQARLTTFLNPGSDPQGTGYNVRQAAIAVGSGGVLGQGLTAGSQSQLNFLPAQHTDFVFAVLSEKLGFVGASLTIVLFTVLLFRVQRIARRSEDPFSYYLSVGILAMLFFHIVINIGMNLQLLPVTGLPLTFISFGGTHLLVAMTSIGLLQSALVYRHDLDFV